MTLKEAKVSLFSGFDKPCPIRTIGLFDWLTVTDDNLLGFVDGVRKCTDKKVRGRLKESFYAITPSGVFSWQNNDKCVTPSGFISIDIDNLPPNVAKDKLSVLPFISYIGTSVSGNGVWALIPISSPENFSEHFYHIKNYMMEAIGIKIDASCGNISRLRGYSFDSEAYFNLTAQTYTGRYIVPQIERKSVSGGDNDDRRFGLLLDLIESRSFDITNGRENWVKIGIAIAGRYGLSGESYFDRISQYHPKYNINEIHRQYRSFLKSRAGVSMSTIFWIAKNEGLMLK